MQHALPGDAPRLKHGNQAFMRDEKAIHVRLFKKRAAHVICGNRVGPGAQSAMPAQIRDALGRKQMRHDDGVHVRVLNIFAQSVGIGDIAVIHGRLAPRRADRAPGAVGQAEYLRHGGDGAHIGPAHQFRSPLRSKQQRVAHFTLHAQFAKLFQQRLPRGVVTAACVAGKNQHAHTSHFPFFRRRRKLCARHFLNCAVPGAIASTHGVLFALLLQPSIPVPFSAWRKCVCFPAASVSAHGVLFALSPQTFVPVAIFARTRISLFSSRF